jgi:hypothetical protein
MLHVTNGDSAAQAITAAGITGDTLAWREVLHEGPLPAGLDPDELRAVRARFFAQCGWGEADEIEADLRAQEERLLGAHGRELIVLWFEHDLFDQLQLLQILDMLDDSGGVEAVLSDRFLAPMDPGELVEAGRTRAAVTTEQLALARLAWSAVRANEPVAIEAMQRMHTAALPHLSPALRRLLEELPAVGDGLSRSERQALEAIAAGARTPIEVFVAAQKAEEAPFMGDTWMWRRLHELGQGGQRLVQTSGGEPVGVPPPVSDDDGGFTEQEIELTDAGRAVLAGDADRAALVPLDRWVGGTHVFGPDPAWRWDRAAQRAVTGNARLG